MGIFLLWIFFAFVVAGYGSGRTTGFWGTLIVALFLSPLVGFIYAATGKDKESEKRSLEMLELQKKQVQISAAASSPIEQIEKLQSLKELGAITSEEFEKLKARIV